MTKYKFIFFFFYSVVSTTVFGLSSPVKWTSEVDYSEGVTLVFKATIDSGWHFYDHNSPGGMPATFTFESGVYQLEGELFGPDPIKHYEELFESDVYYHEGIYEVKQKIKLDKIEDQKVKVDLRGQVCQDEGQCILVNETFEFDIKAAEIEQESAFWIFWAGFIGGLLALLTPCVFPMIPMTVTFFTKMSKTKAKGISNAFIYGLSIIVIYVSLGLGISSLVGAEGLNQMATSVTFNLIFFVVFVVFAISFLGAFEITIPSSLTNKMDAKADKGGLIGVFFMAFTLALVSFSCTGPVIGTLLVESAVEGGVKGPFLGMLGFSSALALPFTLFAIFPSWLNTLPRSGGWLNAIKVTLGLLELALALKFLSNVDLVYQARILTREVFLSIWIVIFFLMGYYLLGKLKFAHDSDVKHITIPRISIAILSFSFVVYMIPGLFGAPLKLLSGVLPPTFYTEGWTMGNSGLGNSTSEQHVNCPNNLDCYHDYDQALAAAKEQKKPLLIDFTGLNCTNCRVMEQNVWSDPKVDQLIREKYVLVSLFVDDRTALQIEEQKEITVNGRSKKLKNYGDKWSALEISKYGEITQPLYVLLGNNEEVLQPKRSYDTDVNAYAEFLQAGLAVFEKNMALYLFPETITNDTIHP